MDDWRRCNGRNRPCWWITARSGGLIPAIVGDLEIEPRTTAARSLAGLASPTVVAFLEGSRLGSTRGREFIAVAIPPVGREITAVAIPPVGREITAVAVPPVGREIIAVPLTRPRDVPAASARGGPVIDPTACVRIVGPYVGHRAAGSRPVIGPTPVDADIVLRKRVVRGRFLRATTAGRRIARRPILGQAVVSGCLVAIRVIRLDHAAAYITPAATDLAARSIGADLIWCVTRPWQFRASDGGRVYLVTVVLFHAPTPLCPGFARRSVIGGRRDPLLPYGRPSVDDAQLGAGLVDVPLLVALGHAQLPAAIVGAHFRPPIAVAHLRPSRIVGQIPARIRLLIEATGPIAERLPHLRQVGPQPLLGPRLMRLTAVNITVAIIGIIAVAVVGTVAVSTPVAIIGIIAVAVVGTVAVSTPVAIIGIVAVGRKLPP